MKAKDISTNLILLTTACDQRVPIPAEEDTFNTSQSETVAEPIGSCSELVQTNDGGNIFGRYTFLIDSKLVNGDVTGQVLLVNSTKGAQKIA